MTRIFIGLDGRLRSGWRVAGFLVAFLAVQLGVGIAALVAITAVIALGGGRLSLGEVTRLGESSTAQLVCGLAMLPLLLLVVWPFRRFLDRRSYRSLGFWVDGRTAPDALAGLAAGAALVLGTAGVALVWGLYRWAGAGQEGGIPVLQVVAATVGLTAAALNEELVCRAYVQGNLAEGLGPTGAIALTSGLFSLLHGANPHTSGLAFINLFLAGVLLGTVYHRFGTLWAPWALHFAWNFTMGPLLGVSVSGMRLPSLLRLELVPQAELAAPDWEAVSGGAFGFEGGLAATMVMALFIVGLAAWKGRPPRAAEPVGRNAASPPPSTDALPAGAAGPVPEGGLPPAGGVSSG